MNDVAQDVARTPAQAIEDVAKELHLTMRATFVPFSISRNKDSQYRSLNWLVTLARDGHDFLTTDYGAGIAHCPSYKASMWNRETADYLAAIKFETEKGYKFGRFANHRQPHGNPRDKIAPSFVDVLYSLMMDSSVLDSGGFKSWASDYCYDTDSRDAEKSYHACLEIALKLQNVIGTEGMQKLREACQDY